MLHRGPFLSVCDDGDVVAVRGCHPDEGNVAIPFFVEGLPLTPQLFCTFPGHCAVRGAMVGGDMVIKVA